ncbi:MAG: ubiquinone-binding protein [Gammaproteobacteria bacterium RIFCSPHIGHO2_12_FULL_45_9]|nr:MAG: ubiquinone-binding protein [Gammaproteobacteria bacterium RIFCSPHIGHO2_12_FULL_45_9]
MPTIQRVQVVPYSIEQMYDLVNDIVSYTEFVPFCSKSEVLLQTEDELRASLTFSKGGLHKSFSTQNRLKPHKIVEMRLLDGPFRQLEGFWRFETVSEGSRVSLDLEFEFASTLMSIMFGPVFNTVASSLVDAFTKRAHQLYSAKAY